MKILSIGSCNRDMVYSVDHIAVGGETISAKSLIQNWGGKGLNQAVAVARSFPEAYMAGMIHSSDASLRDYMHENNLNDAFVAYSEEPTGHAVIYVDRQGQNSITVYGGANTALPASFIEETLVHLEAGDIVLMQNETNGLEDILRGAHARGVRVAMNPSPFTPALLELPLDYVSFFFINEIEGHQITGETEPSNILSTMRARYPEATVVLTLGAEGAMCAAGGEIHRQPAYRVPVVDTTAAGDAFTGYFLASVAQGLPLPEAMERASRAAAITVSRMGAVASIPYPEEVSAFVGEAMNQ